MNKITHLEPWSFAWFNFSATYIIGIVSALVLGLVAAVLTNSFALFLAPSTLAYVLLKLLATATVAGLNGLLTAIAYNVLFNESTPILATLETPHQVIEVIS